jgi:fused signal recognition particle receptor
MRLFSSKKKSPAADLPMRLSKTKETLLQRLSNNILGKNTIDDYVLDDIEETLISADIGVDTSLAIIERIKKRAASIKNVNMDVLQTLLREEILDILCTDSNETQTVATAISTKPYVIMVVGVNGAGKTTTIGKLAAKFVAQNKKVYIGAADTFRAAAIEQLQTWTAKSGAILVKQKTGADPASVAFDTLSSAKAHNADIVLIDTAGRLHNKINLMNELAKIRSIMNRVVDGAPHETMLVLDGSTGQNAYQQVQEFAKATQVSSLAITKLDGTAKGGVVIGISAQFNIPVKYIGIGEQVEDLQEFDGRKFVDALLK